VTISADAAKAEVLRDGVTGVVKFGATAFITAGQLAVITDPAKRGSKPELPFRVRTVPLSNP
jgi:hypothetical protein